jgi:hypothetical protein
VALIPSKLQRVLGRLYGGLAGRAEDAYATRDAADAEGDSEAQTYAAGQASAYGQAAQSVREAQDEAAE